MKKKTTIDDLAVMMKKGFDGVDENLVQLKKGMNEQFSKLEVGQEDIKLRLDQAAYRFEMQALEKRVEVLEKKAGIEQNIVKQH